MKKGASGILLKRGNIISILDIAPDPVSIGIVIAVVIFIIVAVIVMAGALVLFLWYRKRRRRAQNMIRPDDSTTVNSVQLNNPNQP